MEVKVVISVKTAIKAGHAQSGTYQLEIPDAFVAELNDAERDELIRLVQNSTDASLSDKHGCSVPHEPVSQPGLPALKAYIRHRIEARTASDLLRDAEKAEALRKKEEFCAVWLARDLMDNIKQSGRTYYVKKLLDVPDSMLAEYAEREAQIRELVEGLNADAERQEAEKEVRERLEAAESRANIQAWISENGSVSMQQREVEGVLPEKELLSAVRDWIFQPLEGPVAEFSRYTRLQKSDARHDQECDLLEEITFEVDAVDELSDAEYQELRQIRISAQNVPGSTVQAREHRVVCQGNKCPGWLMRRSALVSVEWNGYKLSREYALTAPGEDASID